MKTPLTFLTVAASAVLAAAQSAPQSGGPDLSTFFWSDFDGDGLEDALVFQSDARRLLSNRGDGRFIDVTLRSGLAGAALEAAHAALWGDFDGDGREDLYLPAWGATSRLMRQVADGSFEDVTEAAGVGQTHVLDSEWVDFDRDGDLDLHLVTWRSNVLYQNLGTGLFETVDLGLEEREAAPPRDLATARAALRAAAPSADPAEFDVPTEDGTADASTSALAPGTLDFDELCAGSIRDRSGGPCLEASSVPTLGRLYPLGNEFFIDAAGYVGLSTLNPGAKLDVVGGDVRTDGQLISTATSGAPLAVSSSAVVTNLNADRLDGFEASAFSQLGNTIGALEIEPDAVGSLALAANAVQSIHIFPNTINSLDIASGGVLSDEIQDGTILDVDINPLAAIAGTKINASFGAQTVTSSSNGINPAMQGVGANGPTGGYLGAQGTNDFGGITGLNWAGQEIGVAGVSAGSSITDNYGVAGYSNYVGVRGEGDTYGVEGRSTTVDGYGVYGVNTEDAGFNAGVVGELTHPDASGRGVSGIAPFYGVWGDATSSGVGVGGTSLTGLGVYGRGFSNGVIGDIQELTGGSSAIYGLNRSSSGKGVLGQATSTTGVTDGVRGESSSTAGRGVYGYASSTSGFNYGVFGQTESTSGRGVRGEALATSGTNFGVQGRTHSPTGWGVISYGSSGTTGQKNFIQPHPTDPTQELRFFSLEGNESGTYFRGSSTIVAGTSVIEVPEEFRLVSTRDRLTVQLTPISAPALLWIESKNLHQIVVRCDEDVEFDYTVNGIRRGFEEARVFAQNTSFVPEVRGEPYGTQYPDSYRDILVESGILNADYTPNEALAQQLGWILRDPIAPGERAEPVVDTSWITADLEAARAARAARAANPPAPEQD